MNLPGFTAQRSLTRTRSSRAAFDHGDHAMRGSFVIPADVPGGPGNVPIGYNRECKRVPYTVCDARGCRREYGWVCYLYPIRY
jgi:hypothetical protein